MSILAFAFIGAAGFSFRHAPTIGIQRDGSILVQNGQQLTPAGTHIEVNDRPLGMVLSPNHRLMAVATGSNFNPRALHLIDVDTRTLAQTISITNSFVGVAFSPARDKIFVGGGASNDVKLFSMTPAGTYAADGTIPVSGAQRRAVYRSAPTARGCMSR